MAISKREAASRQLVQSIRLLFSGGDELSICTLAHASFVLLKDVHKPSTELDSIAHLKSRLKDHGRHFGDLAKVPNFLKHADRDPLDTLEPVSLDEVVARIGLAAMLHPHVVDRRIAEIDGFLVWWVALAYSTGHVGEEAITPFPDPMPSVIRSAAPEIRKFLGQTDAILLLGSRIIDAFRMRPDYQE